MLKKGGKILEELVQYFEGYIKLDERKARGELVTEAEHFYYTKKGAGLAERMLECVKSHSYYKEVKKRIAKLGYIPPYSEIEYYRLLDISGGRLMLSVSDMEESLKECKNPRLAMSERALSCVLALEELRDACHVRFDFRDTFLEQCPITGDLERDKVIIFDILETLAQGSTKIAKTKLKELEIKLEIEEKIKKRRF